MLTLHLIAHTHWDREWYLPFQEFRLKLVHLIDLLLDILDQDPAFTYFTLDGQTILLEDYLEIRPEREPDLIRRVREGRLLIGPWYVLPDEFLVSPEALIRNLLLGGEISRRFGHRMDVGYVPDPFGHIGQLPQILKGFGIEAAAFRRGLADEPCELWWEAADGSRVLTAYLRDGYDNAARLPTSPAAFEKAIHDRRLSLEPHAATRHLLILNGTDHQEPQPEIPPLVRDWRATDAALVISTLPRYFGAIREEIAARGLALPVFRGEARNPRRHHLLPAVLSGRTWIKQRNHECETLLEKWGEPFSAWAEILAEGIPERSTFTGHLTTPRLRWPRAVLHEAWRILLQCHPHDSICGCSVDPVHEQMKARFDQVNEIAEEITRQSLAALAEEIDTASAPVPGARSSLVVFNPHAHPRTGVARGRVELAAGLDAFQIQTPQGEPVPFVERSRRSRPLADMELDADGLRGMQALVSGGHALGLAVQEIALVPQGDLLLIDVALAEDSDPNFGSVETAFTEIQGILAAGDYRRFRLLAHLATEVEIEAIVPDVPAHGYRSLFLTPRSGAGPQGKDDAGREISNESLTAQMDEDGTLRLTDRASGAEYSGLLPFRDVGDRGDSYTFCPVAGDEPLEARLQASTVRRSLGPCGQTLTASCSLEIPFRLLPDRSGRSPERARIPIEATLTLRPGVPRLDIEITVENHAEDHRLQVVFPLAQPIDQALLDGAYEIVRRPTRLPSGGDDWAEQPAAEQPMRCFVGAEIDSGGLLIANRGVREASVTPEGEIAVTLLRAYGWLSQDDLVTRKGGAGPKVETPGGQVPGRHRFSLSIVPIQGSLGRAIAEAYAFQSDMRAVGTRLHAGRLPGAASFIDVTGDGFELTAVKQSESDEALIVRGVNLIDQPVEVALQALLPIREASRVRLDETTVEPLAVEAHRRVRLAARPHEIVTLRLRL
jgi:alpha-mannosidase